MTVSLSNPTRALESVRSPPARARYASLLIAGALASAAAAWAAGDAAPFQAVDPELTRLLRGMALIKGGLVLGAMALLLWRLRSPIEGRVALGYLLGAWAMSGATVMIWQLSHIGAAAGLFHLGALTSMLLAWRDDLPQALRAGARRA